MNTALAERARLAEAVAAGATITWLARAHALRGRGPLLRSAEENGAPPAIIEAFKAAVPAGSVTNNPELAGASAAVSAFVAATAEQSLLLRLIADSSLLRVPLQARILGLAADITGAIVGEGKAIPLAPLQWTRQAVAPFKIAAVLALSDEAWRDLSSAGQAFVTTQLRQAVGLAADRALFSRVLTSDTPTETALADNAGSILRAMCALLDAVHVRPGARLCWGISPGAANALATLDTARADLNPFTGSLLGMPATITSGLSGHDLVLVDGRAVAGDVVDLQISSSTETTLEMMEDPVGHSVTPVSTTAVSLFQNNLLATKVVLTLGLAPIRDVAAGRLTLEDAFS